MKTKQDIKACADWWFSVSSPTGCGLRLLNVDCPQLKGLSTFEEVFNYWVERIKPKIKP
jgi:hypothetical protein